MMKRKKGMQDILNECCLQFPLTDNFDDAFPGIKNICIQYCEEGMLGIRYATVEHSINDKRMILEYIKCSNALCSRGGFHVGEVIRNMIKNKKKTYSGSLACIGSVVYSKKPRHEKPCYNTCKLSITIQYDL